MTIYYDANVVLNLLDLECTEDGGKTIHPLTNKECSTLHEKKACIKLKIRAKKTELTVLHHY